MTASALDIEELERRLELATAPAECDCNGSCPSNTGPGCGSLVIAPVSGDPGVQC